MGYEFPNPKSIHPDMAWVPIGHDGSTCNCDHCVKRRDYFAAREAKSITSWVIEKRANFPTVTILGLVNWTVNIVGMVVVVSFTNPLLPFVVGIPLALKIIYDVDHLGKTKKPKWLSDERLD